MASFNLYLGSPQGQALLAKKERLKRPDEMLGASDDEVLALDIGLDPYAPNALWSGPSLDKLRAQLEERVVRWQAEAEKSLLAETRKSRVESWMQGLLAQRFADDKRIALGKRLIEFATRAATGVGTILFSGD